jgi:hypothetical protein
VYRQSGCRNSGERGSFREYWPFPPGLADAPWATREIGGSADDTEWPITMATNLQVNQVKINEDAVFCFHRRNEMLGLGLVGTIIVIVLIVWLVRRV